MAQSNKCAHPGCSCAVPNDRVARGNAFCSDYCERHGSDQAHEPHECSCGHTACAA